ncbi:MAG: tRNA pseudouridine(13) synthase TruD [Sulfurovum sp.]|nr:tRNA pseudouridine(13) synthase TruD [Sulfurovum sp.]
MKTYAYEHDPVAFQFLQSVERFFVEEMPLFEPSGKGNFLLLDIKKYDLSTWRLLNIFKEATGADDREIGYAGLKDKNASTIQRISLPKKYEKVLKNITTDRIEILDKNYNHLPLKIGQLAGNKFEIILTNISTKDAERFDTIATKMQDIGIPNYFGYQRFGEDGKSWQQGKDIAHSQKRLKGAKEKLLVSAYQSHLFNQWLSQRINLSKVVSKNDTQQAASILKYPVELIKDLKKQPQFFKLFIGEVLAQYPQGKQSFSKDAYYDAMRFQKQEVTPTGMLCGDKVTRAFADARHLEEPHDDDELISLRGDRRVAWIWSKDFSSTYDKNSQRLTVKFTLPKGSYATSFLEEIGKQSLLPEKKR